MIRPYFYIILTSLVVSNCTPGSLKASDNNASAWKLSLASELSEERISSVVTEYVS